MPSDPNFSSSSFSSDGDNRNPNSDPSPVSNPNTGSIDRSLDALESQLASISMSSRSPTATLDGEDAVEEEVREARLELQHRMGNGPLNEDISTEGSAKDELTESNWKAEASGENDESPSYSVWRNVSEAEELERPLSPSSSGYAGERGSTSGGCEINDDDEDSNEILEVQSGGDLGSHAQWVSGKRHPDEDDASVSWRKRKKHFFILSNSGKPIYSRYGDEHKLAGFSATLQAIISFVENGGDRVQLVRAGNHQVVFLVKGPIYLVCISYTEETYESLRGQLELLYGQMILILTKSVNRCFERNPKFDMTSLLGGTDVVFSSLIHSFSWYLMLHDC